MAQKIALTSGSVFAGNPVTFTVTPEMLSFTPSFHRVVMEVTCGLSGGSYDTISLTAPVTTEGTEVKFDIASALRVPLDDYTYTPDPVTYPFVSWHVCVYDEYMDANGAVHTKQGELYMPSATEYYRAIAGGFSDFDRFVSAETKAAKSLTRKPVAVPQLVAVGETYAYTPSYADSQSIGQSATLEAPTSVAQDITAEGLQTIDGRQVYALPESDGDSRQLFRFINSFGVLESVSVPRAYSKTFAATSSAYAVSVQETFSTFSRAAVKKVNNQESWLFTSDPLNEEWAQWYLHEFLMSEHMWMLVNNVWLPCTVTLDDELTIIDRTKTDMLSVSFTATLDINGSPYL